jgi:hypothetical protein
MDFVFASATNKDEKQQFWQHQQLQHHQGHVFVPAILIVVTDR